MAEENTIQIGSDLYNIGRAISVELSGKIVKIDYGFNQKIINHSTEPLASDTLELIDAAIDAATGNNDHWYSYENQRYHIGAATSIQKRNIGNLGSSSYKLVIYFDNAIKQIVFETLSARDTVYTAIKTIVEAGTDAALWVENDDADKLFNFDNAAAVIRIDDTTIRVEQAGDGIVNIVKYADKATLDSDLASWGGDVKDASVAASVAVDLIESTLNAAIVTLTLVNDTFVDSTLSAGNFTLVNAPTGCTVDNVAWVDDNEAEVTLAFDGTDLSTDVTDFKLQIAAAELVGASILTTRSLTIGATLAIITVDPAMTEINLDGSVVRMVLTNDEFASGVVAGNFTLNNEPAGTTIDSINRVDDVTVDITLAFDLTDFDANVTDFNITIEAAGIEGDWGITSDDLTITAIVE